MGEPSINPTDPADRGVFITKVCNIVFAWLPPDYLGVHYLD